MRARLTERAPLFGIAAFTALYVLAAILYPGGNRVDPASAGFSVVENYFCELLEPLAQNQQPNPGRPYAIAAMLIGGVALACFFQIVPRLARSSIALARVTRVCGVTGALVGLFLFTRLHDAVIVIAGAFGMVAMAGTLAILARARRWRIFATGIAAALASILCFAIWVTGVGVAALGLLQKAAFALFLLWVALVAVTAGRATS